MLKLSDNHLPTALESKKVTIFSVLLLRVRINEQPYQIFVYT